MAKNKKFEEIVDKLTQWAKDRELLDKDPHVQFTKVVEELGETSAAYNKEKHNDLVDSIGDLLVTIIIFSKQVGLDPVICLNDAWREIEHRHGKTINGVFVKDSDLNKQISNQH